MKVRVDMLIVHPPLQRVLHVLDRVIEVFLDLAGVGSRGNRKVAERCESAIVLSLRVLYGCCIGFIGHLLIFCNLLLPDQRLSFFNPFSLPLLVAKILQFHS
jgi:hypothetical protein